MGYFASYSSNRKTTIHQKTTMLKFIKRARISSLQKEYDLLMHEAYAISQRNPEASLEKQRKALAIQREILAKSESI